jgi:hypothetical protein
MDSSGRRPGFALLLTHLMYNWVGPPFGLTVGPLSPGFGPAGVDLPNTGSDVCRKGADAVLRVVVVDVEVDANKAFAVLLVWRKLTTALLRECLHRVVIRRELWGSTEIGLVVEARQSRATSPS